MKTITIEVFKALPDEGIECSVWTSAVAVTEEDCTFVYQGGNHSSWLSAQSEASRVAMSHHDPGDIIIDHSAKTMP